MVQTRIPAVAGSFYPEDQEELKVMIDEYLSKATVPTLQGKLMALVVPHAGYIYSAPVAAFSYKLLSKYREQFDRIIMIGPSHYARFEGLCETPATVWETPFGKVNSGSFIRENKDVGTYMMVSEEPHANEHALEVQLPFLQIIMKKDFIIYPLLTGKVSPEQVAEFLADQLTNRTLILVSSDLSHYHSYSNAIKIDKFSNESIPALDITRFEKYGEACGKTGILSLMHLAKSLKWKGTLLNYRNSGDTSGDKSRVVGYGAYAFASDK